jgi:hypothetical protein
MRVARNALSMNEVYPRGTIRVVKRTFVSCFLGFFVVSAFGASFLSDEQALRRLEREHALATYMGNANWFRLHTSNDYVLITGSGVVKTKAELIAEIEKGAMMEPYEPAEVTIRGRGSVAIVSGRILQRYNAGGEHVTADLRFSDVWIRTDEGWVNISGQLSPVSIKSEPIRK